jgi:hypothetical protein
MTGILDKCRILYKGDVLASLFYLLVGVIFMIFSVWSYYRGTTPGFTYLAIGFFMFFLYAGGKGTFLLFLSVKKYAYFKKIQVISNPDVQEEIAYTEYRINKKSSGRRWYIRVLILSTTLAFLGIFSTQKSLLIGTCIPISLISGIELGVGLLNEFRLREYFRILQLSE